MPKRVDHEDRRRAIADAVLAVVADQGVTGATFRAVADESSWSTGVLSHYFRNRDDMLLAALRRAGELAALAQRGISSSMTGRDAVRAILEEELPLDSRRLALTRIFVFFYAEAAADESIRAEINGYLSRWRKQTEVAVRAAQECGEISADFDAAQLAARLVALTDGLSIHAIFDRPLLDELRRGEGLRAAVDALAPSDHRAVTPPSMTPSDPAMNEPDHVTTK